MATAAGIGADEEADDGNEEDDEAPGPEPVAELNQISKQMKID